MTIIFADKRNYAAILNELVTPQQCALVFQRSLLTDSEGAAKEVMWFADGLASS